MTTPIGASARRRPPPPTADRSDQMGKDTFLKLLVAQLRYQDPSNPASSSEFMAQTATFTQVEKLEEIAAQNDQLLTLQQLAQRRRARRPHRLLHRHRRDHDDRHGQRGPSLGTTAAPSPGRDRRRRRRPRPHHRGPARPTPPARRHRRPPRRPLTPRPKESPCCVPCSRPSPASQAHQTKLDVAGNNIANVNTVGFKCSPTVFQDTLSQVLRKAARPPHGDTGGTNPAQVGLGVQVAGITTNFGQGVDPEHRPGHRLHDQRRRLLRHPAGRPAALHPGRLVRLRRARPAGHPRRRHPAGLDGRPTARSTPTAPSATCRCPTAGARARGHDRRRRSAATCPATRAAVGDPGRPRRSPCTTPWATPQQVNAHLHQAGHRRPWDVTLSRRRRRPPATGS